MGGDPIEYDLIAPDVARAVLRLEVAVPITDEGSARARAKQYL